MWAFSSTFWNVHCCHLYSAHCWLVMLVRLCGFCIWYDLEKVHNKFSFTLTIKVCLLFCKVHKVLGVWIFCECIHWDGISQLCILIGCGFLSREVSLMTNLNSTDISIHFQVFTFEEIKFQIYINYCVIYTNIRIYPLWYIILFSLIFGITLLELL